MCPSAEKQVLWQSGRSKTTNTRTDLKVPAAVGLIATQTAEQDVYRHAESALKQWGAQGSSTSQPVYAYNEWNPLEVDSCTF